MRYKLLIAIFVALAASTAVTAQSSEDNFFSSDWAIDTDFESSFSDDWDPFESDSEDNSSETDDFFGNDPFFSDETDSDSDNSQEDRDLSEIPGCQEGEVHIPEDTDCDGEIEDRFRSDNSSENDSEEDEEVTEQRHVTPAPEPSATGEDWISYPNPRDHYKHPEVHREGSIKVCKILLNENNEVITGETVPDTTFQIDTNIPYEDAQPVTFTTELNQVADLVGTSPDLREGDGYLDAECAEFHDLSLNQTYHYSEETISGENADNVELVGYQEYWERETPPYKDAEPYGTSELSDGELRLTPGDDNRHAEVIVVNRISR